MTVGIVLLGLLMAFFKNTSSRDHKFTPPTAQATGLADVIPTDTLLNFARAKLTPEEMVRLATLEHSISRGDVKSQQLKVYHQLAHFWNDSIGLFPPYAWYIAEAARLENSEKTLTFAAHLILDSLERESDPTIARWEATQAKDLFERSLKINPDNDSSKVGIGACYMFGGISNMPMEGITKIMEVTNRDSTNLYAQMTLVNGALVSGQREKAISRLQMVNRMYPKDLDVMIMLADIYDRDGQKMDAVAWYQKGLPLITQANMKKAVEARIEELKK